MGTLDGELIGQATDGIMGLLEFLSRLRGAVNVCRAEPLHVSGDEGPLRLRQIGQHFERLDIVMLLFKDLAAAECLVRSFFVLGSL